jgi:GAF domain-containing protein
VRDGQDQEQVWLLNALLWGGFVSALVWGLARAVLDVGQPLSLTRDLAISVLFALGLAAGLSLLREGQVAPASAVLVAQLYLCALLVTLVAGGVGAVAAVLYVLSVIAAAALLSRAFAILSAGLSLLTALSLLYAEKVGWWSASALTGSPSIWVALGAILAGVGSAVVLLLRARERALAAANSRLDALQSALADLRETTRATTAAQDRQIRYLGAVASIARDVAGLLDEDVVLSRAASLAAERLGLHHVGIYVLDRAGKWLHLRASADPDTGEVTPWELRVQCAADTVIGRVASTATAYLVEDSHRSAESKVRDGLIETRSRYALPIGGKGRILGVLDMHSQVQGTFAEGDAPVLAMLADQIAAGIENAAQLRAARERGGTLHAEHRQSAADAWRRVLRTDRLLGLVRTAGGFEPARGEWHQETRDAARRIETVTSSRDVRLAAVPITVRGEVIAVLDATKPAGSGGWSPAETSLLEAICVQLGEALENARLYDDIQRREARERLLGAATTRMRASLDPDTVVRVGVDEIRAALSLAALDIRLGLDDGMDEAPPAAGPRRLSRSQG